MSDGVINIDVVSDVACPWCYVGKRKFEAAVEKWNGAPIKVTWHPYQLDPSMPASGLTRDEYLTNKFGSVDAIKPMTDRLIEAGSSVGITFDFGENWLAVNTLQMHQLLRAAREEGFGNLLKERFLSAYFENCEKLNQPKVLHSILAEFGWNSDKVDQIINDESLSAKVREEIVHYKNLGVTGVPFFIVNNKYGISGAQPTEVFLETFASVANEK